MSKGWNACSTYKSIQPKHREILTFHSCGTYHLSFPKEKLFCAGQIRPFSLISIWFLRIFLWSVFCVLSEPHANNSFHNVLNIDGSWLFQVKLPKWLYRSDFTSIWGLIFNFGSSETSLYGFVWRWSDFHEPRLKESDYPCHLD